LKSANFWKKSRRSNGIEIVDANHIRVNGNLHQTITWLQQNEAIWCPEWIKWSKHVALCSRGSFSWDHDDIIGYRHHEMYLSFVEWKKECYIKPSYELLPQTREYQFLELVWKTHHRPLGLVHPKAMSETAETPITRALIRELYDSPDIMCCQPYVIAGRLLNVPV